MKFDTIIIGGGLSGLVCGIRLSQQGQRCVIISSGQSALHFSSGSFDLLNTLPDGEPVYEPLTSVKELIKQNEIHPYSKIGEEKFLKRVSEAEQFLSEIGISTQGNAQKNHFRITPIGNMKSTWLTLTDFAVSKEQSSLPWKKVAIYNIAGFLDFYPQFIADEFAKKGTSSEIYLFSLPALDRLRKNPTEMRSTNIARVFDKQENIVELINILKKESKDCEAIIFPACLGFKNPTEAAFLSEAVGKPVHLVATLPPSIAGIRMQQYLHDYFQSLGGVYMLGDNIKKAEIENNNVSKVYSYNHGNIPFIGKNVVLATGSYFSQGLIATQDSVYEPIFGLDVSHVSDRQQWYSPDMFKAQGYQHFGVKTNKLFQGLYKGAPVENLYVAGAILEGFNPIKEGSGGGVSILSALEVADNILSKYKKVREERVNYESTTA